MWWSLALLLLQPAEFFSVWLFKESSAVSWVFLEEICVERPEKSCKSWNRQSWKVFVAL